VGSEYIRKSAIVKQNAEVDVFSGNDRGFAVPDASRRRLTSCLPLAEVVHQDQVGLTLIHHWIDDVLAVW
jgi:hypothetical protein